MCDPDGFEGRGIVLSQIEDDRLWVEMPNGHRVVAVKAKKSNFELSQVQTGDTVAVFFSPSDMARGTILNKMDIGIL
jgi:translation initiation factor IF-1